MRERRAFITVRTAESEYGHFPWQIGIRLDPQKYLSATVADFDGFYANLMTRNIEFFRTGEGGFPGELAMALVAVLEGAEESQAGGVWVECAS